MSRHDQYHDPDDMFAETRMTFGEHIEDLRTHLIRAILGFLVAMTASFFIAKPVLRFIDKPVREQLANYWDRYNRTRQKEVEDDFRANVKELRPIVFPITLSRHDLRDWLFEEIPGLTEKAAPRAAIDLMPAVDSVLASLDLEDLVDWKELGTSTYVEFKHARIANPMAMAFELQKYHQLVRPPSLTTQSEQEAFMVYVKVVLMCGFVLGSPWIFYQIWMVIAAGLYPHEKKYVNMFLPFSLGLFLAGTLVCEFFVMPKAIEALLWFNEWLGFSPDLRLNEWLGFAIFMPLVFGISFQTPLVMLFLQRVGILTVERFRKHRRIAWFALAVFAAVITPSVDPFSMCSLWIPMGLLYELGIGLCVYLPGRPLLDFDFSDTEGEELVEV